MKTTSRKMPRPKPNRSFVVSIKPQRVCSSCYSPWKQGLQAAICPHCSEFAVAIWVQR